MRICEANTRILRANFRLKTDAMFVEFQLVKPSINGSPVPRRIELCAGRGRKENAYAFLARGRGRRQAAEAGADLRSKYADSPRKAPTLYRCDVIESQPAMHRINGTPNPRRIELYAGRER